MSAALDVALRPGQAQDLLQAPLVEGQAVFQYMAVVHCVLTMAPDYSAVVHMSSSQWRSCSSHLCPIGGTSLQAAWGPTGRGSKATWLTSHCHFHMVTLLQSSDDTWSATRPRGDDDGWVMAAFFFLVGAITAWTDEVLSGAPASPAIWRALSGTISGRQTAVFAAAAVSDGAAWSCSRWGWCQCTLRGCWSGPWRQRLPVAWWPWAAPWGCTMARMHMASACLRRLQVSHHGDGHGHGDDGASSPHQQQLWCYHCDLAAAAAAGSNDNDGRRGAGGRLLLHSAS